MEPYPIELRERILAAYQDGMKTIEIARTFHVSPAWTRRVKQWMRERGHVQPLPHKRGPDPLLGVAERQLQQLVRAQADATLDELRQQLEIRYDIKVCRTTVWQALEDLRLPLKMKSPHASEQNRADVKAARADWQDLQDTLPVEMLVFIDESAAQTNMARTHGRCERGQRLEVALPAGCWDTTTVVSGIRIDGPIAPWVVHGPLDGDGFATYAECVLAPELHPGDIVILDNLRAHKDPRAIAAIERAGATVAFLPAYSPDLNPIENMWSKVKQFLRSAGARTTEALLDAIAAALRTVTSDDCDGFFVNCGYGDT